MLFLIVLSLLVTGCHLSWSFSDADFPPEYFQDWGHYLGDPARTHYSALDQINTQNVQDLELAWIYHSEDGDSTGYIQASPLVRHGTLYSTSPHLKVFAIDAATGKEQWSYDPFEGTDRTQVNRGVAYWEEGQDRRILFTAGAELYALDADTGELIEGFGDDGRVDLRQGLGRDISGLRYGSRTPGTIYRDLIILGSRMSEALPSVPGHIRAFNVRTGEQEWIFHTIPHPDQLGYETWEDTTAYKYAGGANNWAGMALDEKRGIVYVPTGSASYDYYGGNRKGKNLFANSLIALDAGTGARIWHFQAVHHDLWDRDLPAPPNLVTVERNGRKIPAVAQVTKSGHVFLFHRVTGDTLFPIEERPAPPSDLVGEEAWPTQPLPLKPPPFTRQGMTAEEINPYSRQQDSLRQVLARLRKAHPFTPPSLEGTLLYPGLDGGAEWGGAAWDPQKGLLFINANEMPWVIKMAERDHGALEGEELSSLGRTVYQANCTSCHGVDREGSDRFGDAPSLVNIDERLTREAVRQTIENGGGAMPSFAYLTEGQLEAVTAFLFGENPASVDTTSDIAFGDDIQLRYYKDRSAGGRLLDGDGYPAIEPPWGTLNAIDLNSGEIVWKVPLGEHEELTERGIPPTGTENYGGPIVTAGGLVFIGATKDPYIRAFDRETGEVLWKHELPAAGMATPATYEVNGQQYIVIAAAGGKREELRGDAYVAFTLPEAADH